MRFFYSVFVGLVFAVWDYGSAHAQEEAKERARALTEKGQAAYDAGRFVEAAESFEEANRIYPHPNILFNAAKAWEAAAEYDKAANAYRGYLDLHESMFGTAAPDKANVEKTIELLREKAYRALPEVTIDSDPPGADVLVDDPEKILGQTPFTTHLGEGTHRVYVRKPGFQEISRDFVVRAREPVRLTFTLERVRLVGGLRFKVNVRNATIFVDGKSQGLTPYDGVMEVEAGQRQVVIQKERYSQVSQTVSVEPGQVIDVTADLYLTNPPFSWRGYVGIVSTALGAGLVVTSAVFFRKEANKYYTGQSEFKKFRNLTYLGYGLGGALIGAGAGLLVWEFVRKEVERQDLISAGPRFISVYAERDALFFGASGEF